ncbi:TetR/AcrR family transcriptional regulator [Acidiferrimicrobium sp. IK]|uniref:TetR/AcrR family transcriptional regulator n=1 Tax=Acidiferrimicrobium sp. IK TaxID=2871700 RepID=UPI0021CAFF84|nr:TetR/AcrR family transcriptional regulator [Acidiferrimicrobium sp. IK]MCU4183249.1 TetR/AcrR family transcriptional regulator [Acidiferrimicrobium sp. IK]
MIDKATRRALARHQEAYSDEVRRLLDAGLEVMRRLGTTKSPRVADIIEGAGLSRDAFYRHFASKEDLVEAIVEAGTWRLVSYAEHRMQKATTPEGKIRAWIEAIMSQAVDPEVARSTRAVLWNGGRVPARAEPFDADGALSHLLIGPLSELPSPHPARDAAVIGHAVGSRMRTALQHGIIPDPADVEHLIAFCLSGIGLTSSTATVAGGPTNRSTDDT